MEATLMKLVTVIGTTVLSLALGLAAPAFAQEQHEQEDQKAKPAQEEKKAQPEKSAKQEEKPAAQAEKNAKPEGKKAQPEKSAKQEEKPSAQRPNNTKPEQKNAKQTDENAKPEQKNAKQADKSVKPAEKQNAQQHQSAGNGGGGRIPQARFQANFGRQHTFHVSQADYSNHRFQYGGYWFGFADPWPSNWLYTQDVFVVDINGVYYLCNANFPGVNIALSFTL
jgi:cytoskeletal protein RodZ